MCKDGVVAGRAYEILYVSGPKRADGGIRGMADAGVKLFVFSIIAVGHLSYSLMLRPMVLSNRTL